MMSLHSSLTEEGSLSPTTDICRARGGASGVPAAELPAVRGAHTTGADHGGRCVWPTGDLQTAKWPHCSTLQHSLNTQRPDAPGMSGPMEGQWLPTSAMQSEQHKRVS